MAAKAKVTPLMAQYTSIKSKYPDALLLFRVGDFYETFGEDAVKTARVLNIVQTHRNNGSERTELAGFPHHALNTYLPKLVKAGFRVAICDQLEDPKQTKSIVKRGVTELVTPGVSLNDDVLESKRNNFLASIHFTANKIGAAFLDISTGDFFSGEGNAALIQKWLQHFEPSEVLINKKERQATEALFHHLPASFYLEDWVFHSEYAEERLKKQFQTQSLKGFGLDASPMASIAAGSIIHYLNETHHHQLQHITGIQRIQEDAYVWLDRFTIQNLELLAPNDAKGKCLLDIIDHTSTPMGGRLLKRWLLSPLKDKAQLNARHNIVEYFINHPEERHKLADLLKQVSDIERISSKIATRRINPKEFIYLKNSLETIVQIKTLIAQDSKTFELILNQLDPSEGLSKLIKTALADEAPVNITKGGAIATGYHKELDELRNLATTGKAILDEMLERETQQTGISSLKIGSNNVFGYYFEVRNTHKDKVPQEWIRKQTLVNAERYINEELKTYEDKIVGAEERILQLEQVLFEQIISESSPFIVRLQKTSKAIAQLDCLHNFAKIAASNNYQRPEFMAGRNLSISEGRHPVIEQMLPKESPYIANDVELSDKDQQVLIITGPNMSGKSALLRQTALIVLLAQMGSFVPAQKAKIGIVDKIFTRVGASDNLSAGESTFMTEMLESASILNNISGNCLVLLDEIGRGTSTYDGLSIAWAMTHYLHDHPEKPKVLFATHYHELNEMAADFPSIKNYHVSVKELKDRILFTRKLLPGGSNHSFGIHVAKMAGMPQFVIHKAEVLLKELEQSKTGDEKTKSLQKVQDKPLQLSFFNLDDPLIENIKEEINALDINTLTPVEALMKLNEIKRMLSKSSSKTA